MTTLPQVNARIVAVNLPGPGQGGADDYDDPQPVTGGLGDAKWTGSEPAYYHADSQRSFGGEQAVIARRQLIIASSLAIAASVATGDVVTFTFGGQTQQAVVQSASVRVLDGIPAAVQTTKLEFATS